MVASVFDLLKQHSKKLSTKREKPIKLPDGESQWRILPDASEIGGAVTKQFWRDFGVHYVKKPGTDKFDAYVCESITYEKECAVCAQIAEILHGPSAATLSAENKDAIERAKAQHVVLANAIRTDAGDQQPVVLALPKTVWKSIFETSEKRMRRNGTNVFSTIKGVNFFFTRSGTGRKTEYSTELDLDVSDIQVDAKKLTNLEEYVDQRNREAMDRILATMGGIAGRVTATTAAGALTHAKPSASAVYSDPRPGAIVAEDNDDDVIDAAAAELANVEVAPAAPAPTVKSFVAATSGPAKPAPKPVPVAKPAVSMEVDPDLLKELEGLE